MTSVTVASATRSAERVAAYIDGFNLYFGIREHGRRYLWLDLEGLLQSLLKPHQQLVAVRYFTARVRNDAPAEQRQQVYLNALAAHCSLLEVRQGRFQEKSKTCHSCGYSYKDYEEKESDVSLAVSLVEDGVRGLFDTALIVSADGDMAPGICALRRLKPDARILAAFPPNRRSQRMAELCDVTIPIGLAKVRQAQLPETVMAGQHPITRPDHWK